MTIFRKCEINKNEWVRLFCICVLSICVLLGAMVSYIDPWFHFHGPNPRFYYELNDQRDQNDGIIRHFNYDAMIIGTSMTENFKTSEAEKLFGMKFIKTPFSGATFLETNREIVRAVKTGHLKAVFRGLDPFNFLDGPDDMFNLALSTYPEYLYDNNPLNDVNYLLNSSAISTCLSMIKEKVEGKAAGVTSFDEYLNWQNSKTFGGKNVLAGHEPFTDPVQEAELTQKEHERIRENITQNVISVAQENPDIQFYYFITPCSAVWWGNIYQSGLVKKWNDAEREIIELILQVSNIHLFSWNTNTEITCDLNNYTDDHHYREEVNSLMLQYMHDGVGELTIENYSSYLDEEYRLYSTFDYNKLFDQAN